MNFTAKSIEHLKQLRKVKFKLQTVWILILFLLSIDLGSACFVNYKLIEVTTCDSSDYNNWGLEVWIRFVLAAFVVTCVLLIFFIKCQPKAITVITAMLHAASLILFTIQLHGMEATAFEQIVKMMSVLVGIVHFFLTVFSVFASPSLTEEDLKLTNTALKSYFPAAILTLVTAGFINYIHMTKHKFGYCLSLYMCFNFAYGSLIAWTYLTTIYKMFIDMTKEESPIEEV